MPRYFFTSDDGLSIDTDDEGLEFPDDATAIANAQEAVAEMARERLPDGSRLRLSVTISDARRVEIYTAQMMFKGDAIG